MVWETEKSAFVTFVKDSVCWLVTGKRLLREVLVTLGQAFHLSKSVAKHTHQVNFEVRH